MNAIDYGLIGHPLGHSLSPMIHRALLAAADLPGDYRLYDLTPDELPHRIPRLMRELAGFNCTIPYKEAVLPYLDRLDDSAASVRSVNTIWRGAGYNTDYQAFCRECPLPAGARVLILGAGGVSRTMAFAAAAAGAAVTIIARRPEQARTLAASVSQAYPAAAIRVLEDLEIWRGQQKTENGAGPSWILLNGTPVGLWPGTAGLPFPVDDLAFCRQVYDTIYNPVATRLVLAARSRGIPASGGLGMLFSQALAAEQIWHPGHLFPAGDLAAIQARLARAVLEQSPLTIILTGFMGSGKTTVGRLLAKQLKLPFIDLDQAIETAIGRTIPAYFAAEGEPAFRNLEQQHLQQVLKSGAGQILAAGGGTLLDPAAESLVRNSPALVVFLDTSLEKICQRVGDGEGRPMIYRQGDRHLRDLFSLRQPRYRTLADLTVDAGGEPEAIAGRIAAELGFEQSKGEPI
ncbi:MAG: shikimate kinase [Clostridiaceae bacterium]|nr:shikimate kinase [Clostridiaceae bacterium]